MTWFIRLGGGKAVVRVCGTPIAREHGGIGKIVVGCRNQGRTRGPVQLERSGGIRIFITCHGNIVGLPCNRLETICNIVEITIEIAIVTFGHIIQAADATANTFKNLHKHEIRAKTAAVRIKLRAFIGGGRPFIPDRSIEITCVRFARLDGCAHVAAACRTRVAVGGEVNGVGKIVICGLRRRDIDHQAKQQTRQPQRHQTGVPQKTAQFPACEFLHVRFHNFFPLARQGAPRRIFIK